MKSGREPIIYSLNWEKIRHFLFLALQSLCFSWSYSFEKGLIFSEKGLKIWREGLAAEERLLQNVKIEIENVLNSLLLPGSAENAPARRDHSETWQMPGYIKALTRTLNKVTMWALRFQTHWKSDMGRPATGEDQQEGAERMQDQALSWRKYLECLKWQGQYYRLGQSPTLRSFSKIEAKLRSVELKNAYLGNGSKNWGKIDKCWVEKCKFR